MVSKIVVVIDENELMKVLITDLSDQPADSVPSVFTKIHVKFVVTGRNLKESQVKRAPSVR